MKKSLTVEKRRYLCGYVFVLPWVLGFALFMLYPLIQSFLLSISRITDLKGLQLKVVGMENYEHLFTENIEFVPAFISTLKTSILWTPFILVFALIIALLLNQEIKLRGLFRIIYFLPVLLGNGYIFEKLGGATNILEFPESIETAITFYFSPRLAEFIQQLIMQIISVSWKTGVPIIIFLAGLQSIPESYYEAAKMDNASGWYSFWKITLPLLSPIILLNAVYTLIDSFRSTDNEIAALIVNVVFKNAEYEYGSAMGWSYFTAVFAAVGLVLLIFRKAVIYDK